MCVVSRELSACQVFFQLGAANIFRMTILTTVFFVFYVVFSDVFPTTKADLLRLLLMNC